MIFQGDTVCGGSLLNVVGSPEIHEEQVGCVIFGVLVYL